MRSGRPIFIHQLEQAPLGRGKQLLDGQPSDVAVHQHGRQRTAQIIIAIRDLGVTVQSIAAGLVPLRRRVDVKPLRQPFALEGVVVRVSLAVVGAQLAVCAVCSPNPKADPEVLGHL